MKNKDRWREKRGQRGKASREEERDNRGRGEKQMVAEKRQIETQWDDNTGIASEAQQGV